jgi:membrane protein
MRARAELLERARRFLGEELWRSELRPRSITAAATRALQLCVMIGEGFFRDRLLLRASALAYMATLSVIPVLVVALSIVSALGVSVNLAELAVGQITAGSPEAKQQFLRLVEGANLAGLGALGAGFLFVTTVLALRHAEATLNDIWGVRRSRNWARRFADYLAVLIVAPLFTGVAMSLAPILQSGPIVQYLLGFPVFELLYQLGLRYTPTLFLFVGFSFLYWFLPNTRVRPGSALLGGVVAAVLFTLAQKLYVEFTVNSARNNALFGGFAALPLLLTWIYLSCAIILLGSEVSFAHQNLAHYRREVQDEAPGPAEREAVGIRIAVEVARAFRDRAPPRSADWLSEKLNVPVRTVRDLLQLLEVAGIVSACAGEHPEGTFQLGSPAEEIAIAEVLAGLRGQRQGPSPADADPASQAVRAVLGDLEASVAAVAQCRSLADVLREVPRSA